MIRPATYDDVGTVAALAEAMHEESRYADLLPFDAEKFVRLLMHLIASDDGLLLIEEADGRIVGGFAGSIDEHWCSPVRVASDYGLYVQPGSRGASIASGLLMAFVEWAGERGAAHVQIGITTGVHLDATSKLYERHGFAKVGHLFEFTGAARG